MKVETVDGQTLGIGDDLVCELKLAMDIYHETVQSIAKEKKFTGTVKPIKTNVFKGKGIFIKANEKDTSNLVKISKVEVSSFGVELFIKDQNKSLTISYTAIQLAIKHS